MKPTIRTPERRALMRAEYADAVDAAAFLAKLNALPGPPIASVHALRAWACQLRLKKAPETRVLLLRAWSAAGGNATAAVYAGRRGDALRLRWTPEREDIMRAEYPDATDPPAFLARLNERPGLPIGHLGQVSLKAMRMGLAKTDAARLAIGSKNGRRCVERGTLTRARTTRRTPERLALMLAGYPAATDLGAFLAQLNALAGPAISTTKAVRSWASLLGLRKTPDAAAAIAAKPHHRPKIEARRAAEAQAREERKRDIKPVAFTAPRAPEMRRRTIALPVMREPAPVVLVEPRPEIADAAINRQHAQARAMLAKKADPEVVRARTKLPLREVYRLAGEVRMGVRS